MGKYPIRQSFLKTIKSNSHETQSIKKVLFIVVVVVVSQQLNIPVRTIETIVHKWKEHHSTINQPCTGASHNISVMSGE